MRQALGFSSASSSGLQKQRRVHVRSTRVNRDGVAAFLSASVLAETNIGRVALLRSVASLALPIDGVGFGEFEQCSTEHKNGEKAEKSRSASSSVTLRAPYPTSTH